MPSKTASKIPPIAMGTIPTPLPQLSTLRAIFSISLFLRQGLNYVCSPGWPETRYKDQAGLQLGDFACAYHPGTVIKDVPLCPDIQ